MRAKCSALGLAITIAMVISPATAGAAPGALSFADCVTSSASTTGCTSISSTTNALIGPTDVVVSPDGNDVYVTSDSRSALVWLHRDPGGALSFRGCLTSPGSLTTGCTALAANESLVTANSLAITGDGRSVYVTSDARHSVAHFTRDPATGAIAFSDCLAAFSTPGCTTITTSDSLVGADEVAVSPSDTDVYVLGTSRAAVAHFRRGTGGNLSYVDCITSGGATGCNNIGATTDSLVEPAGLAVSSDGGSVLVGSDARWAVVALSRNGVTGSLGFVNCVSSSGTTTGCTNVAGTTNAISCVQPVVSAPDGRHVYAGSWCRAAISALARNPTSGALSFASCITGSGSTTGCTNPAETTLPSGPTALAFAPGTSDLYASDGIAEAAHYARAADGALAFRDCLTSATTAGCTDVNPPTDSLITPVSIAASADGADAYVAGDARAAIVHLRRQLVPSCTDGSTTVPHGATVNVPLACTDANGQPLTREILSQPASGTLGPVDDAAGTVPYTPALGYAGPDSFIFRASDGTDASAAATASLTVEPAVAAPGAPGVPGPLPALLLPDTTAPTIVVRYRRRQRVLRNRAVLLTVTCSEACRLDASAAIPPRRGSGRRPAALGRLRRNLAANRATRLRLRLSRRGRARLARALKQRRRVAIRLTLRATDNARNSRTIRRSARAIR